MTDFEVFFSGPNYQGNSEWDKLLSSVRVPGMPDASWDRRAAWLVFNGFNPAVDTLPAAPDPLASLLPPVPAGLLPR